MDYLNDSSALFIKTNNPEELIRQMLEALPLSCVCWDKNFNNIAINRKTAELFKLPEGQVYLDNFATLNPQFQPNGQLSAPMAQEYVNKAFKDGSITFEWLHQDLEGQPIPCEIHLVRANDGDDEILIGYIHDLRPLNASLAKIRKADERTQVMLDATPLCANFWDKNFNNIDCNLAAATLFDLKDKQEYLERFNELSPEFQPDGQRSADVALEKIKIAFAEGICKFEWMHQKLNGEPIPSEITLKRVLYQGEYIVAGYTRDLRELKATMEKMREADERSQIMLDATPLCANFWDENFNNIDCNQEAVNLFELKDKQEYLDRFAELSPEFQPDGSRSTDLAREKIATAFETGICKFEWMHQKLNGEPVPSEIILVRVKHKTGYIVVGYTRDLRELKATMAQIRAADERTQIMLDATPLCCNLWDTNFNNIDCNQEAVNLFELKDKQEYLNLFYKLSPEYQPDGRRSQDKAREYIQQAFNEGYARFEWMHQKLDGEQIPAEITLVRVQYKDGYIVAGYTRDLRELKAMLAEMHMVEADLRLARDAAENSAHAKSEFLANMSHEIRTPMNGILGMLHLVLNTEVTDQQRDYLQKTEHSAKTLLRILNDILDFSKIEAGKLEMEHSPFALMEVFTELKNIFAPRIKTKNLDFSLNLPPNMPKTIIGDSLRLKQVLFNIMGNAVKFTRENGKIEVGLQILKHEEHFCYMQFMVKDNGIGMKPDQIRGLFSPFTQADTSITRTYGGTGLGLAISKNLVEMMEGKIWVTSEYGIGSSFYFTARFEVPVHEQHLPTQTTIETRLVTEDAAPLTITNKAHILLAEDNEINQMIAQELLEKAGHFVDIVNNGSEALEMLQKNDYDLVLMDIQMPIMDGLTATRAIRADARYAKLPIIAMSAHAMSGDREKSLASGMNDHLTKPIDPEIFYQTLNKWIVKSILQTNSL